MVPPLDQAQQEELKEAVEQPPAAAGIELVNWYWKVVWQFVLERFCNQGPKHSRETPVPILRLRQMRIPLWLWFRIHRDVDSSVPLAQFLNAIDTGRTFALLPVVQTVEVAVRTRWVA